MEKIAIIGSGNYGANAAAYLAENNLANVVLVDAKEGVAKGKALDLMEAAPVRGFGANVVGADDLSAIAGAKVVVFAAGVQRKPGQTIQDLLAENEAVLAQVLPEVKRLAPEAILVIQREPVAKLALKAVKDFGFKAEKVIGLTGLLESTRFRFFLAKALGISAMDTTALVIGGAGEKAVPLTQYANVSGVPITELLSSAKIEEVTASMRTSEESMLAGLKFMPAYYTPAATLSELVMAITRDQKRYLPVTVLAQGAYGLKDVCVTLPALVGPAGVEKVIELPLTDAQKSALAAAAQA